MSMQNRRRAFTLIELLVVIAIIALLVAILLPALGKAKVAARLIMSLNNCKQLGTAMQNYRTDFKDFLPMIISNRGGNTGWSTWSYGGNFCNNRWESQVGGLFDEPAGTRPLNPYVYPSINIETVGTSGAIPVTIRKSMELAVFRSPGDKASYQWFPNYPTVDRAFSSYEDVGTSYHTNMKWWNRLLNQTPARAGETTFIHWRRVLQIGMKRMGQAANFRTSEFVWIHDQIGDIVAQDPQARFWNGEFGGRNRAVMTYLDGHADYTELRSGVEAGPRYSFFFPTTRAEEMQLQNLQR